MVYIWMAIVCGSSDICKHQCWPCNHGARLPQHLQTIQNFNQSLMVPLQEVSRVLISIFGRYTKTNFQQKSSHHFHYEIFSSQWDKELQEAKPIFQNVCKLFRLFYVLAQTRQLYVHVHQYLVSMGRPSAKMESSPSIASYEVWLLNNDTPPANAA